MIFRAYFRDNRRTHEGEAIFPLPKRLSAELEATPGTRNWVAEQL